jgi:lipopolysaccharide transport system permease protein
MFSRQRRAVFREGSGTPGPLALLRQGVDEIRSRRRLIRYLVQADAKKRGSDTVLGNLWWIVDPLLQMAVYVVFVTIISKRPAPDYPLFIFAAILPWKWYSSVVTDATAAVVSHASLIRQIAFPKIVLPVATATAGIVGFGFGLVPLIAIMVIYGRLTPMIAWIPVIAVVQYVFAVASAIFLSAANVFFRDLGNVAGHVLRLWWFLSPGLYSLASLDNLSIIRDHPILRTLASLNPFAVLFESYRIVIYGAQDGIGPTAPPNLVNLAALLVGSLFLVGLATIFFKRAEPDFAKVL